MADSDIQITAGSGTKVDTRTVGSGADEHRQVMVIGDPATAAEVASVSAANGLEVDVTRITGVVAVGDGTNAVAIDTDPADGEPNSGNALHVEGRTYMYNGSTWDRARGTISNGLLVDVSRVQGRVQIGDATNSVSIDTAGTDAESNAVNQLHVQSRGYDFNGTTWDRRRGYATVFKAGNFATAQTGFGLWTPASGNKIVVTSVQIQSGGTTSGTFILWFGASGDTTYTRSTDAAIFDGEFAPSNTNKPGVIMTFPTPIRGIQDYVLRVTTTNAQTVTVTVWGYEV
jgi:hypothetical protein